MKKIFTLLCAAVLTLSTVNAEVLLKESFGQATETLATNENVGSGSIEATGWTNISGSGQIYMSATDLTYTGYKSTTDGTGSAEYKVTFGKKAATPLKKSISSGSVYTAAIIDVSAYGGSSRDYAWALCTSTSSFSTATNHYSRLCFQKSDDGFQLGIAKQAESAAFISYTDKLTFGKYLVVMEYKFVDGDKNDIIYLYLNPVKGDKPAATLECKQSFINPNTGSDVGSGTKDDAAQLVSLMLYSSSSTKAALKLDELKVATEWTDLWESGEPVTVPTIIADDKAEFGNVTMNEAAQKKITIKGENLTGGIAISSSSAALVPSTTSITKADAEAEGGYELTLTLTATVAGAGSATLTLSSENATSKNIAVSWTAAEPVSKISIADAKKLAAESDVALNDVVITRIIDGYIFAVQDATGALYMADYYGASNSWKVGDKISGTTGIILPNEDQVEGFCTVLPFTGSIAASGVAVDTFAVTLADFTKYGPALVKVQGVSFASEATAFAAGGIQISQNAASANLQIPAGCDIIGEAIPASADVKGIVCHPYLTDNILIQSSADVYNRVPKGPTGMESIQPSAVRSQKMIRNGQMIIVKDGKAFNVLGAEL